MAIVRRKFRPLPPSVPVYPRPAWVDPHETAPPLWRRLLSAVELAGLVVILGVVLAAATGILLLGTFFAIDFLIS